MSYAIMCVTCSTVISVVCSGTCVIWTPWDQPKVS